ncbi:MAG: metal-dependent transcriptional regulator [Bacteroidota bacterium]|nr:metal-dependent transcriptional regulator [Bacteroidota bacterium]
MTFSEENYIKIIYHLSHSNSNGVSTNAIAQAINSKPSSVTDMIQKLADKQLVSYIKYQGVLLTPKGMNIALNIIRKHRLWEVFLVNKLQFSWDEVHEIAEQLEHIQSEKLVNNLDRYLGFPDEDPHGDPIPKQDGSFPNIKRTLLAEAPLNIELICIGVKDTSKAFLQYLNKQNIALGTQFTILEKESYDNSLKLNFNNQTQIVSHAIANNIFVKIND